MSKHLYFHSPFSESYPYEEKDRCLLLSFILCEFEICSTTLTNTWTFSLPSLCEKTYDAPLNRLQEHARLLPYAFPEHKKEGLELQEMISYLISSLLYQQPLPAEEYLQRLFIFLDPFIQKCKQEAIFLFFLLNHYNEIQAFTPLNYLAKLFHNLHPEGLSKLQKNLCEHFHKKGLNAHLLTIAEGIKKLPRYEAIYESSSY